MQPLHIAAYESNAEAAKILLDQGAHANAVDRVKFFLSLSLQCRRSKDVMVQDSMTPLHWAALVDAIDVAKLLLNANAPVNAVDKVDWAPLHEACQGGSLRVARALMEGGADIELKTRIVSIHPFFLFPLEISSLMTTDDDREDSPLYSGRQ